MNGKVSATKKAFGFRKIATSDLKRRIARYGRGNVRLQLGHVVTSNEYEEQRRRVLAHDFR